MTVVSLSVIQTAFDDCYLDLIHQVEKCQYFLLPSHPFAEVFKEIFMISSFSAVQF